MIKECIVKVYVLILHNMMYVIILLLFIIYDQGLLHAYDFDLIFITSATCHVQSKNLYSTASVPMQNF